MEAKTIRFREGCVEELKKIAHEEGKTEAETLREIVDRGLREYKIEMAIYRYQKGVFSQGAAAEFAGLTIQEFHQELRKHGSVLRIDKERVKREIEEL